MDACSFALSNSDLNHRGTKYYLTLGLIFFEGIKSMPIKGLSDTVVHLDKLDQSFLILRTIIKT